MRLGLVIYGSLETVSGGYLYDRKLVEHLQRRGDTVEIVSLPSHSYGRCLGHNFSGELLRRLEALPVDALLQDELNHPSLFLLNRHLHRRIPRVSIVHHLRSNEKRPAWQNRLYGLVEGLYLRSLDGLILNSQATQKSVQPYLHRSLPQVVAYPAGDRFADLPGEDEIARRAALPGPLRLAFLGNLIERKGLHTLLSALALLPPEAASLAVIGGETDPAYAARLRLQIERLKLQGRVRFLGRLPDAQVGEQLRQSQVLVNPSSYEGFGIVYLEGMGFGLPAIGGTQGAAGEIITHGQDGFLAPPEDPATLAALLAVLVTSRERLLEMSLAARRRFLAHPTWEQSMEAIRTYLCELTEAV